MFRRARSWATILIVLPIVMIADVHSADAQGLRRFLEGGSKSSDPKPSNSAGEKRMAPPSSPAAPSNSASSRVAAQQNSAGPSRDVGGARGPYPTALNSKAAKPPKPQAQFGQPLPGAGSPRVSGQPYRHPQAEHGLSRLPQNRYPSNNPNGRTNSNIPAVPPAAAYKADIKNPATAYFNSPTAAASRFDNNPVTQPQRAGDTNYGLPVDASTNRQPPSAANPHSETPLEAINPVNVRAVLGRFGLDLTEKGETVSVTYVDAKSNAAQSGLKRGDTIVSLGGAPVMNVQEFSQIAALLAEGDQIELGYSRDGKEEKTLVQYGSSSETPADTSQNGGQLQLGESNWAATPQDEMQRLQQLVAQQRQVIAELQKRLLELEKDSEKSSF